MIASGIIAAGGSAAYLHSRFVSKKTNSSGNCNGFANDKDQSGKVVKDGVIVKKPQKKGGLKSLQVLTAILLSEIGQMGARDLLALVGIVVSPCVGCWLACTSS